MLVGARGAASGDATGGAGGPPGDVGTDAPGVGGVALMAQAVAKQASRDGTQALSQAEGRAGRVPVVGAGTLDTDMATVG